MPKYELDPDRTYTDQEVFDRVVSHLRDQGNPAVVQKKDGDVKCQYRADGGRSCAIGGLIPDDLYNDHMDDEGYMRGDTSVDTVVEQFEELAFLVPHLPLLHCLQDAHDMWAIKGDIVEEKFKDVAKSHGLTYTPPAA